jgi:ankyrin repeat protein
MLIQTSSNNVFSIRKAFIVFLALAWSGLAFGGEIHDATGKGDLGQVKALLKENPSLVSSKDDAGATALHFAAQFDRKDVAELLLANKADVNAKTNDGLSPLQAAVQFDHKEMVELLLANKANVNIKANNGYTCLHVAAGKDYIDVARVLLANSADVNARENNGETPLGWAIRFGHLRYGKVVDRQQSESQLQGQCRRNFFAHCGGSRTDGIGGISVGKQS